MFRKFFEIRSFVCYKIGFNLLHTHALIFNHFICVNIYLYENYTQFSRCCQEKLAKFMFKLIPQKTLLIPFQSQKFLLGTRKDRYSRLEVLYKRFVLRNFAEFFGKHLSSEFLYLRSCELTKFFKKTYLVEHLRTAYRRM